MSVEPQDDLLEAVYRAALDPDAWDDVMRLAHTRFRSTAQTFYVLDMRPRRVRPMSLRGIEPQWLAAFDRLYFTPDNPWLRLTGHLHRPGVVRTNERLARLAGDDDVLYRSVYYNEWMRPQRFRYTIGNTLLADDGVVANVTLLRPPDMPTFDDAEVAAFERLTRHMTLALRVAVQLERADLRNRGVAALDGLADAVALIDSQRRPLHVNAAMEALLRGARGLALRGGRLSATHPASQSRFAACVAAAASADAVATPDPLLLPRGDGTRLSVRAIRAGAAAGRYLPATSTVLVTASDPDRRPSGSPDALRELYGCTRSEARLASLLADGRSLREAADAMGITYESARAYLKLVFAKVGVRSQAQLVSRMLGGGTPAR
jgi:DNA-binding CsgD family transcriptional regulator/PAS domain-containing protein